MIDSLTHPHPQKKANRIQTRISLRLPQHLTKKSIVRPRTLITLPTYSSVLQTSYSTHKSVVSNQLISHNMNCYSNQVDWCMGQLFMGSRVPHNGHLVDPFSHTIHSVGLDTGAHNAPVRDTPARVEEEACEQHMSRCTSVGLPGPGHRPTTEKERSTRISHRAASVNRGNLTTINIRKRQSHTMKLPQIYLHNMRSLNTDKFLELKAIANQHDLIMLTETWLDESKESLYTIENFVLHTCHRKKRIGGGVAVYVRADLPVTKICSYANSSVSCYWLMLHYPKHSPIILSVLYHPPNQSKLVKEETMNHIITTISKQLTKHKMARFLICGDFNDLDTTELATLYPLEQLVDFPPRGEKKLDLVFTDIDGYIDAGCTEKPPIATNDHCALVIPRLNREKQSRYTTIKKRTVTPSAKYTISQELFALDWEFLYQAETIDEKVELLQSKMTALYHKHCPERSIQVPLEKPIVSTPLIRKLQRAKQRAYRKNKPSWKFLSKLLSRSRRKAHQKHINSKVNSVMKGTNKWWNNIKNLTGESQAQNKAPFINIDDNWFPIATFTEKLNSYYLEGHTDASLQFPDIPDITQEETTLSTDENHVYNLLADINTRKSTNSSDFPSWISRNNAHQLAAPVTHIINCILSKGVYPTYWKTAEITPINKVKNPKTFKDMRPISLLFHLGKITEKVIVALLHADLPPLLHQYAYSKSLSTTDALVKLTTDTVNQLDDKDTIAVQALMLDFSKAFDRMRPDIVISRLLDMNVNPQLASLVQSFLSNRSQCVRYQGITSSYKQSHMGVPQGTIMGPILWNVFVNSLEPSLRHIKYADDTTLYNAIKCSDVEISASTSTKATITFHHANPIQVAAEYSSQWCLHNSMLLNTAKSCRITFTLRKSISSEPVTINNAEIEEHVEVKLLGVTLDQHLRFTPHVDAAIKKSKPAFHALVQLKRAGVNISNLTLFYRSRILPILTYAAPCWFPHLSGNDKDKLEKYQRLCLRIIMPDGDYTERLVTLGLCKITEHLQCVCCGYVRMLTTNVSHPLHHLVPTRTYHRRTGTPNTLPFRSALLHKSLFHSYV